jgi:hypothetical protein
MISCEAANSHASKHSNYSATNAKPVIKQHRHIAAKIIGESLILWPEQKAVNGRKRANPEHFRLSTVGRL